MGTPASSTTAAVTAIPTLCAYARARADHRLVLPEEAGVEVDGVRMLDGDVDVLEDRIHGTDDLALLAVDAHVGIDVELRGAGPGMDASDRAHLDAGSVVGTQAGDDVRHGRCGKRRRATRGPGADRCGSRRRRAPAFRTPRSPACPFDRACPASPRWRASLRRAECRPA